MATSPPGLAVPPPAPRPPNHGALPLRAGTPGPGPGPPLGTAPWEVVFHRISFKIFGLDLAGDGGSLTSAGSRLARTVLAAPHLLRGRQGGNPETVLAGAASPARIESVQVSGLRWPFKCWKTYLEAQGHHRTEPKCRWLHSELPSLDPVAAC